MKRVAVVATLATGCVAASDDVCPESRVLFSGECCAPWAVADLDVCLVSEWSQPTPADAIGPGGARDPEAVVGADGRTVLTWTEADETTTAVAFAEQDADGAFAVQYPGVGLSGSGSLPSLAADTRGRALLSWRQQLGEDSSVHYVERDTDGSWSLQAPPQLSYGPIAYEPRSVYADDGETMVVYNQWTGEHFGVAVARRGGDQLTGPLFRPASGSDVLSPAVLFSNGPIPAVASNGDAIITWYQAPDADLMVFVSERSGADGEFSRPEADAFISAPGAPVDSHGESNPAPAIDDRGAAAVAWTQENGAGHMPVYLATRDGWGRWTTPAGLDDTFSVPAGAARCTQTVFGGEGSLYITWYEEGPDMQLRVFAAHRAPDESWVEHGRDAVQLSAEGANGINPALAVGDEGQALIAYVESDGTRSDLMVRRRNPGRAQWLPAEVLSADLVGDASEPAVAWRDGVFVVAWVHGELLDGQLYVARVTQDAPEEEL